MMKTLSGLLLFCVLFLALPKETSAQCPACEHLADLITNGNFSSGNNSFTSDLNYVTGIFCPLCPENTYTVGINATFYHSDFTGSDHTNPPFGNFFIANGPGTAGVNVWCESFPVEPETDYTFTFWARDITNNSEAHPYALLQPSFNGVLIEDTLVASGGWESFTMTWNSGSAVFLDLCIVNQQSQTGGNDFGLDDISLTACKAYQLSQTADAGPDQSMCSDIPLQIGQSSHNGYTYSWDNSNGLSSVSVASPTLTLHNATLASYTETYVLTTDSAGVGCVTTDTVTIAILPMPPFTLGPDTTICPGTLATLNAGTLWNTVEWSNLEVTEEITVGEGTFAATVFYESCSATDEILVSFIPMPDISLGPDISFCENSQLVLYTDTTVIWNDLSVSDSFVVVAGGTYSFYFENESCLLTDTVEVTMFTMPSVSLPADTTFCQGSTLILDAGLEGLWNTGTVAASIPVYDEGYYDIVVQNGPCITNIGTQVEMILSPVLALPSDTSLCEDFEINLDMYSDRNTFFTWSTGDSTSSVHITQPGIYFVETGNACDTLQGQFSIETYPCKWGLYIPNCFTPNDDAINEGWYVKGYNISNVEIYIYNRLGNLIFHTSDMNVPWTPGTGIGDDVYNYSILATAFDGKSIEEHGHIYLLR